MFIGKNRLNRFLAVVLTMAGMCCLTACSDNDDEPTPAAATSMLLTVNGEHYDIALPATEARQKTTFLT